VRVVLLRICYTALEKAQPFLEYHMCHIGHRDGDLFYVDGNGAQWRSQPKNFGGPKCLILGE